jgi:hypothetical protein
MAAKTDRIRESGLTLSDDLTSPAKSGQEENDSSCPLCYGRFTPVIGAFDLCLHL